MTKRLPIILLGLIIAVIIAAIALSMRNQEVQQQQVQQQGTQQQLQQPQGVVEGRDYALIKDPVRTVDPNKIEVTEVFWYGCGHCNTFRPVFEQWEKQLPEDVVVRHSPAMWNDDMVVHATIFYTAVALGIQEAIHKDIFDAMHLQKKKLLRADEIYPLFANHGISREEFDKAFKSFGVRSMVQQANSRARGYGISGTPEVVVNGKYRISSRLTGSQAKMLQVAESLIDEERNR